MKLLTLRRFFIPYVLTVTVCISIYMLIFSGKTEVDFLFKSFIYKFFFTESFFDKVSGVFLLLFKIILLLFPIVFICKIGNNKQDILIETEPFQIKTLDNYGGSITIITCIIILFLMSVFVKINKIDLKPSEYSISEGSEMPEGDIFIGKYEKYYTIFGYGFGTRTLYEQKWLMEKEYLNEKISFSENYLLSILIFLYLVKYKK